MHRGHDDVVGPLGMARAMVGTAAAQALVGVTALLAGWGSTGPGHPWDIAILTAGFVALWAGSAWLFLRAAGDGGAAGEWR